MCNIRNLVVASDQAAITAQAADLNVLFDQIQARGITVPEVGGIHYSYIPGFLSVISEIPHGHIPTVMINTLVISSAIGMVVDALVADSNNKSTLLNNGNHFANMNRVAKSLVWYARGPGHAGRASSAAIEALIVSLETNVYRVPDEYTCTRGGMGTNIKDIAVMTNGLRTTNVRFA